jgi:WD40 repeat protein
MQEHLRLDLYDSNALSIDYWHDTENPDNDHSVLFFSTDQGCIFELSFSCAAMAQQKKRKGEASILPLLASASSIANSPISSNISETLSSLGARLERRKAHNDWAVKVKYFHDLHSVVSCSPDPKASLVVAQRIGGDPGSSTVYGTSWRCTIFTAPVAKGVNTFAYSKFPVSLVTGGADRQLRLWNPHRLGHPMAALKGHNAPIIDITINEVNGQIISLSDDNVIKVWDIRTLQCLQTLFDRMTQEYDIPLNRIHFNSVLKGKLLAMDNNIAEFRLKGKIDAHMTSSRTHEYPLRAALYNPNFKQIVSGCDGGVVNVWVCR